MALIELHSTNERTMAEIGSGKAELCIAIAYCSGVSRRRPQNTVVLEASRSTSDKGRRVGEVAVVELVRDNDWGGRRRRVCECENVFSVSVAGHGHHHRRRHRFEMKRVSQW